MYCGKGKNWYLSLQGQGVYTMANFFQRVGTLVYAMARDLQRLGRLLQRVRKVLVKDQHVRIGEYVQIGKAQSYVKQSQVMQSREKDQNQAW